MNDVVPYLENFARSKGVKPEEIHVRFTFADGSVFLVQGLKLSAPTIAQGWGMIEGAEADAASAVVIREAHVLKIEFDFARVERQPIGLHTEATSRRTKSRGNK